jgi:hypothetical protein
VVVGEPRKLKNSARADAADRFGRVPESIAVACVAIAIR